MQPKRLVLALLFSTAILIGWQFLFPSKLPTPPANQAKTVASPPVNGAIVQPSASSSGQSNPSVSGPVSGAPSTSSTQAAPHRIITVKTPLYIAKFDTHGAIAVSWILQKNKENGDSVWSAGGPKKSQIPLELVSQKGMERQPREAPFKLASGDAALDGVLAEGEYSVGGIDSTTGDAELNLVGSEKKRLTFTLKDSATNLEVVKSINFLADDYKTEVEVRAKRGDQPVAPVKIQIGPSIGDQGVKHYNFYSVAPEGVASVGDKVERHTAASINENKSSFDHLKLPGVVDWAGVCDTYFSMVAIPSGRVEGLEYVTTEYDEQQNGKPEKKYLISALVPVPADGSRTVLYVGPKDHYVLKKTSVEIGNDVGRRNLDLEGLINYGFGGTISRPIAERLLWCIKKLYELTGSYGVAIILFTIIIYSAFFPLKWRSSKAMKKAQKLAPRMKELQEKIKGMKQTDPRLKELQKEQLLLMKEGNPLGGCLPLLIQMPFLFALYRAITISLDFRQATFLWLPDLSAPEPYFIHVLPILMASTMIVLQLITPAPSADPMQRKMMAVGMPLFMLYILWSAPAGLLLYWLVGNIVGFSQQFLINHLTKSVDDEKPPVEKPPEGRPRKKIQAARVSEA
jgi:YidC/Oxa1 family membrane protein insertase